MTRSDYDDWAEAYAAANDTGFFNAWYERPAMLGLVGEVAGRRILDAGCGSGPTSAALVERGADVSAFDRSSAMVEIARRRLPDTDLRVLDLAEPLPWVDASFDVVVASLVLHYLRDWSGALAELRRLLPTGGRLVASVIHPGAFPIVHPDLDYFGITEYTEDYEFDGRTVDLTFFHRPLSAMADSFARAGFQIAGIHEPPADPGTPAGVLPPGMEPGERFLGFLFFDLVAV